MKIREINRTANVAWSPSDISPIYLVCGTAAQYVELEANGSSAIEVFELDLVSKNISLQSIATVKSNHRYEKITWGQHGGALGVIAAGSENGLLELYSASDILQGRTQALQVSQDDSGKISALGFSHFQSNLLASGSSDSGVFLWDLEKPNDHSQLIPQITGGVKDLAWNMKCDMILASAFSSKVLIADVRSMKVIQTISESTRIQYRSIAWNPEAGTQIAIASEDDHMPVIQIWDVRKTVSPLCSLEGHTSGVLSVSWCSSDSSILASCAKDKRILLWNPAMSTSSGEVAGTVEPFDVDFCPRNPALIAVPSFNATIDIHSIMGGTFVVGKDNMHVSPMAGYFSGEENLPGQELQQVHLIQSTPPFWPPRWMYSPCRPSFGVGGKLLTSEESVQGGMATRRIAIEQVTGDRALVSRSIIFAEAFASGNLLPYCHMRVESSQADTEANMWRAIHSYFVEDPRLDQIQVLGYNNEDVSNKVDAFLGMNVDGVRPLSTQVNGLRLEENLNDVGVFETLVNQQNPDAVNLQPDVTSSPEEDALTKSISIHIDDSIDGLINQSLITGYVKGVVNLCIKGGKWTDALNLATLGGEELLLETQQKYAKSATGVSQVISAVVLGQWDNIAQNCDLSSWKEVATCAVMFAAPQLVATVCKTLGQRLEAESGRSADASLCYILAGDIGSLVQLSNQNKKSDIIVLQEITEQIMIIRAALKMRFRNEESLPANAAAKITEFSSVLASEGQLELALMFLGYVGENDVPELRSRLEFATGQRQPIKTTAKRVGATQAEPAVSKPSVYGQKIAPAAQFAPQNKFTPQPPTYGQQRIANATPITSFPPQQVASAQPCSDGNQRLSNPSIASQQAPFIQAVQQATFGTSISNTFLPATAAATAFMSDKLVFQPTAPVPMMPQALTTPGAQPLGSTLVRKETAGRYDPPKSVSFSIRSIKHKRPPSSGQGMQQLYGQTATYKPQSSFYQPVGSVQPMESIQANPTRGNIGFNSDGYSPAPQLNSYSQEMYSPKPSQVLNKPRGFQRVTTSPPAPTQQFQRMNPTSPPASQLNLQSQQGYNLTLPNPPRYAVPPPQLQGMNSTPLPASQLDMQLQQGYIPTTPQLLRHAPAPLQRFPTSNPTPLPVPEQVNLQPQLVPSSQRQPIMSDTQQSVMTQSDYGAEASSLPAEHLVIYDTLERLREIICSTTTATAPTMKRKLDEVAKKMQMLYEKLRIAGLSPLAIGNLQKLVDHIKAGDYATGLSVHQELEKHSYNEVCAFSLALKVLLQWAITSNVNLQ
ncbi:hypothetical protein QYM36_001641 [Artemia franciscana]|uniref:Protein transport protein Sec31A n=1 Tax=Artemia franciscana TaxID=6661 RepID=A0AA88LIR1_ARTSF|nr:hypothetical protein QYM36_001641 [Artemia franciscana]